jgi:hypothetical protein
MIPSTYLDDMIFPSVLGGVLRRRNDSSRTPTKFIFEWIVGGFGSWQAATDAGKPCHHSAAILNIVNQFHGTHVVQPRIQTNFVQEKDSCSFGSDYDL